MPTPAELARLAATSPGAFVPRTVEEADQEYDRLVRAGIPEAEADALLNQRLTPKSGWGTALTEGLDYAGRLLGNAAELGAGMAMSPVMGPLAAFDKARDSFDDWQAGRGPANPLSPEARRGFEVAKREWDRGHRVQAIGPGLRAAFDALGLPATRAYESLAAGNYGEGAADLVTMGVQAVGMKPGLAAKTANVAGLGLPGRLGRAGAKVLAKGLPSRGQVIAAPAPGTPTPVTSYPTGTATRYLPPTVKAAPLQLPPAKALPRAQQGPAMNALLRRRIAETQDPIADIFASQVAPPRIAQAADDFAAQVSPREQALRARGDAYGAQAAELEAMSPALDAILRGAEQQGVRHTLGRNLATAQDARLGTQVARADASRRGQWHDIRQPLADRPDVLGLRDRLNRREALGSLQTTAARESDLLRRLTAEMATRVEAVKVAQAAGDPIAVARAKAALEQAKTALTTAEGGSLFLR